MHTYNTNQEPLRLKEYGRNIQKLVAQLNQVKSKTLRTKYVEEILKVMAILYSGNTRSTADYLQKYWDDLFIISDYNLNIDSPYPLPTKKISVKRPERLAYLQQPIKYKHCGRHIEFLVKKALELTDPAKQAELVMAIAKLIKNFSSTWNKDNLSLDTALNIIEDLAGNKLIIDLEKLKIENVLVAPSTIYDTPRVKKERNTATRKKNRTSFATKTK